MLASSNIICGGNTESKTQETTMSPDLRRRQLEGYFRWLIQVPRFPQNPDLLQFFATFIHDDDDDDES